MQKIQGLSDREIEVIREAMDGSTNAEIATKIGLSHHTVAVHKYSAYKKMGFRNIVEAINYVNKLQGE